MSTPSNPVFESFDEYMDWTEENLCNRIKDVGPRHDLTRLTCDLPKNHTGKHRGWFDKDLPLEF